MMAPFRTLLIAVLIAIGSSPAAQAPGAAAPAETKTGTIRGRVMTADGGRPLRRARITIVSAAEPGPPIVANANTQGRFEAKDVPAGSYYVRADRAGYVAVEYGQRRVRQRGLVVELKAGETRDGIDLALARGGVLAGRIVDERGEPYPGVRVDALATRYTRGQRQPVPAGGATSDDLGQFRIAGLEPGSYHVVASTTETWRTPKGETYGYASTYYPGGPLEMAQLITLAPAQQRIDLNMMLAASRTARITGRVERENGQPVSGGQVTLWYTVPGAVMSGGVVMTAGARTVRTAADGSFEFKDVPGGVYSIDDQTLTVAGADIEDVVIVARTGSTVTGTLVTDDGTLPPFPPSAVRLLLDAPFGKVLPTIRVVSPDTDWAFKFTNLGGPFLFRVRGLPPDWTLAAVRLGDKDITDQPWDVPTGGREFTGLKIVVTQKVGRVSGTVVDALRRPTSDATVVLFGDDASLWMPSSRFIRAVRPDAQGRFSLTGLPPGTWRAAARESVEDGQWEDRAFLDELRRDADVFTLAEGGAHTIALRVPESR